VCARPQVKALGHRVVHGKSISEPVLVDDAAIAAIQDAAELAPLCAHSCLLMLVAAAGAFLHASSCSASTHQRGVCWLVMDGSKAVCFRSLQRYADVHTRPLGACLQAQPCQPERHQSGGQDLSGQAAGAAPDEQSCSASQHVSTCWLSARPCAWHCGIREDGPGATWQAPMGQFGS